MKRSGVLTTLAIAGLGLTAPTALAAGTGVSTLYGIAGIVPGLGHVLQGEILEGLGFFSVAAATSVMESKYRLRGHYVGETMSFRVTYSTVMYSMYDAYKTSAKVKSPNLFMNYLGAFNVAHALKFRTNIPLGIQNAGLWSRGQASLDDDDFNPGHDPYVAFGTRFPNKSSAQLSVLGGAWVYHAFTAWGEEALFRGFIQHALVKGMGPILGVTTASTLFGLAHYDQGVSGMVTTGLLGAYMGTITHLNKYDMREMIFFHALWNTAIEAWNYKQGRTTRITLELPTLHF